MPPLLADADRRVALDALVLSFAEARDVLPRHLRAFGIALLQEVARVEATPRGRRRCR